MRIEIKFNHAKTIMLFESWLYSVNADSLWEDIIRKDDLSFSIGVVDANAAYAFGYAWCACQWQIEREKYLSVS